MVQVVPPGLGDNINMYFLRIRSAVECRTLNRHNRIPFAAVSKLGHFRSLRDTPAFVFFEV